MPNTTTLGETLRSPIDSTEYVRLATPGANWKAPLSAITRLIVSTQHIHFYVSATGNDANDGLAPGTAWLTLIHAFNYICNSIDVQIGMGPIPLIFLNIGAGTFSCGEVDFSFSNLNGCHLTISGAGMASTFITDGINVFNSDITLALTDMSVSGTVDGDAVLELSGYNLIVLNVEVVISTGYGGLFTLHTGTSLLASGIKVSGSGDNFVNVPDHNDCFITLQNITYNTPTFSTGAILVGDDGHVIDLGTNSGSATGTRYVVGGRLHMSYGAGSLQAGVGTVNGVLNQSGMIQTSDGIWHGNVVSGAYNYQAPSTGFSITLDNTDNEVIIDPSGTLATGTITMAPAPFDGKRVEIRFSQIITALTISPNSGQSVVGNPSSAAVGGVISAVYRAANTTWYF